DGRNIVALMESATTSPPVVTPRSYCDFLEGIPGWVRTNRSALFIARVKTVSLFACLRNKREPKFFIFSTFSVASSGHGRAELSIVLTTNSYFSSPGAFNQTETTTPTSGAVANEVRLNRSDMLCRK